MKTPELVEILRRALEATIERQCEVIAALRTDPQLVEVAQALEDSPMATELLKHIKNVRKTECVALTEVFAHLMRNEEGIRTEIERLVILGSVAP